VVGGVFLVGPYLSHEGTSLLVNWRVITKKEEKYIIILLLNYYHVSAYSSSLP
jgi:hypothetical protein